MRNIVLPGLRTNQGLEDNSIRCLRVDNNLNVSAWSLPLRYYLTVIINFLTNLSTRHRLTEPGLYDIGLILLHVDLITVFPDGVNSQSVPRVTGLVTERTLVTKT